MTRLARASDGQAPPLVVADVEGTVVLATYAGIAAGAPEPRRAGAVRADARARPQDGRYLIVGSRGDAARARPRRVSPAGTGPGALSGVRLEDVAPEVGLDFRHGAFRFRTSHDPVAMMGGGSAGSTTTTTAGSTSTS